MRRPGAGRAEQPGCGADRPATRGQSDGWDCAVREPNHPRPGIPGATVERDHAGPPAPGPSAPVSPAGGVSVVVSVAVEPLSVGEKSQKDWSEHWSDGKQESVSQQA